MSISYTYKGRPVDMGALVMMNEHAVALGNANLNARGDVLGAGREVIKTSEEIVEEYYAQQTAQIINTNEEIALVDAHPQVAPEVVDMSLLSGYDEVQPIDPVKPVKRRAPTAEE